MINVLAGFPQEIEIGESCGLLVGGRKRIPHITLEPMERGRTEYELQAMRETGD